MQTRSGAKRRPEEQRARHPGRGTRRSRDKVDKVTTRTSASRIRELEAALAEQKQETAALRQTNQALQGTVETQRKELEATVRRMTQEIRAEHDKYMRALEEVLAV